jgi:hypothetical protein
VRILPDLDELGVPRWANGAQVHDYPVGQGGAIEAACALGSDYARNKTDDAPLKLPTFASMIAYLRETCSTYKVWSQDEYISRAKIAYAAVESAIVAREFMSGWGMPDSPHLADGNGSFPNGDTATSVINGLALLEQVIALSGKLGIVHCSPTVATTMRDRFAIDERGGVLRTINGNVVIPDYGYCRVAEQTPTGHPAATGTQEWIFCTGAVDVRRAEIFVIPEEVGQAVQRGTGGATTSPALPNSVSYQVERYYLVDWDTQVQGAVRVDRCFTTCTS